MQGLEVATIARLALRKESTHLLRGRGAVLEATLREDGHVESEHRANSSAHDLTLERVQAFVRTLRQLGKGDRFSHGDHRWPGVWAETVESVGARAGVAAHASATVAAGIRERMLDGLDAPPLLIEHAIVHDAPDRELAVLLD